MKTLDDRVNQSRWIFKWRKSFLSVIFSFFEWNWSHLLPGYNFDSRNFLSSLSVEKCPQKTLNWVQLLKWNWRIEDNELLLEKNEWFIKATHSAASKWRNTSDCFTSEYISLVLFLFIWFLAYFIKNIFFSIKVPPEMRRICLLKTFNVTQLFCCSPPPQHRPGWPMSPILPRSTPAPSSAEKFCSSPSLCSTVLHSVQPLAHL